MIDILIVGLIFAYAAWTLFRHVKKSKKGACASCALNKSCKAACSIPDATMHRTKPTGSSNSELQP
ncbi:FeoB-associated Cys-rich membrane protein [Paenibacillus sp.]|jgi:radical SAM protein with 4Fe4S-binding SPASM domain|uniref:FeoB-associated Cys-rich membrane protein n=1 Tax=Paenibacillus sp. TaxID=58172 RepID=UPI00281B157E|nr:FeoB-associated Cys-rich membrane protein [Paenibacillus sp.]MDR0268825.1 FeoB-associated Cys-rich membrane protein [Paenibacillus sp.]